jgi:cardiolipin synthase (CMP-forming)
MRNLNLANLLTASRLALAPVAVWAILGRRFPLALAVFFIAGVTDALDGLAARRLDVQTRLGAYLDPIADKLLLSSAYLALAAAGAVPWWLVILVFARDLSILAMAGAALAFTAHREFPPSVWGKISTLLQLLAAGAALVKGSFEAAWLPLNPFFWAAAAATLWSGAGYLWRGAVLVRQPRPR